MSKFRFKDFMKKHAITNCKGGFFSKLKKKQSDECKFEVSASDAVEAIRQSKIYPYDKSRMLRELKTNESSDYYNTVICIVKNKNFSMSELEMLRCLNEEVNSMEKESK